MLEALVDSVISFIVPTILSALIASVSVGGVIWKKLTKNNRQDEMLLSLGRYRLVEECNKILEQGYMTPWQCEMLNSLHSAYEKLDGNSVGDDFYKRAKKQKIMEVEDLHD